MTGVAYAVGKYAWGQCGKCGLRVRYLELVSDGQWRHLRVCRQCYDSRHPQERLKPVSDPVALWRPTTECIWPPSAPVLTGVVNGTTGELTWTAAVSPDSAINGYRVYRALPLGEFELIATLPVLRNWIGAIEEEPLAYDDEGLAIGTYQYVVEAYDMRNLSARSNTVDLTVAEPVETDLFFDVTLGLIETVTLTGYGYEVTDFDPEQPPLFGSIDPTPPIVQGSYILAIWAWENAGIEIWWQGLLPTMYSTLRIQADGGQVDLNLLAPDDSSEDPAPFGQSWMYWLDSGIWQASELGQVRRITFLE